MNNVDEEKAGWVERGIVGRALAAVGGDYQAAMLFLARQVGHARVAMHEACALSDFLVRDLDFDEVVKERDALLDAVRVLRGALDEICENVAGEDGTFISGIEITAQDALVKTSELAAKARVK